MPRPLEPSLRANGSRECAPDDRLREAIHRSTRVRLDCFVAALLAMTAGCKGQESKKRAQGPPPYKTISDNGGVPGRSEAPPGLEGYFLDFFFDFDFFAFFAFFAFLAIVSSQGLMDGNATRGMLGGGPASQHPRR